MSISQLVTPAQNVPCTAHAVLALRLHTATDNIRAKDRKTAPPPCLLSLQAQDWSNPKMSTEPGTLRLHCRTMHEIVVQVVAQHSPPTQHTSTALLSACNIHSRHTTLQCCSAHTDTHTQPAATAPQADPGRQVDCTRSTWCLPSLCEGVNAGVMLRCHLLACAQAAGAHDLAAASTEGTALIAAWVCAAAHAVPTCEVACTLAVVAACMNLLLDVVHLQDTSNHTQTHAAEAATAANAK